MSARTFPASPYRDKLKRLLDALGEAQLWERGKRSDELQRSALEYEAVERLPVIFSWPQTDGSTFVPLSNSSIYRDPTAMLYNELVSAWDLSIANREGLGDELAPSIRPNWGTVIVASILGGMAEQRSESTPWIRRSEEPPSLEAIAEADPDIATAGWVPRVLETYQAYQELLAPYPELASALKITLPVGRPEATIADERLLPSPADVIADNHNSIFQSMGLHKVSSKGVAVFGRCGWRLSATLH